MMRNASCATGSSGPSAGASDDRLLTRTVAARPFGAAAPGRFGLAACHPQGHEVATLRGSVGACVGEVARTTALMGALDHPLHPSHAPVPARGIPLVRGAAMHRSGHRNDEVKRP